MNVPKLKGKLTEQGRSVEWLGCKIGYKRAAMYRKLTKPEKITVGDARRIADALQLSDADAYDIFLA